MALGLDRRCALISALALALLAAAGCGGGTGAVASALRRPLHLPHLATHARCPTAPTHAGTFTGPVVGPGPVYVAGFEGRSSLPMVLQRRSRWAGQQVVVLSSAHYQGPVLIRGRRLSGPGAVRFGGERVPDDELELSAPGVSTGDEPVGWRAWLVFMRVPASGCYALQVDGTSFSYAIAFEAAVP